MLDDLPKRDGRRVAGGLGSGRAQLHHQPAAGRDLSAVATALVSN